MARSSWQSWSGSFSRARRSRSRWPCTSLPLESSGCAWCAEGSHAADVFCRNSRRSGSGSSSRVSLPAKELQLRGRAQFYANEADHPDRAINRASRTVGVVNGSLRYLLETALVRRRAHRRRCGATGGRDAALPAVGLVLAAAFRLLPALNRVLFLVNQVQYNGPALGLVERRLRPTEPGKERVPENTGSTSRHLKLERELRVEAVTFRYPTPHRARAARGRLHGAAGRISGDRRPDRLRKEHPAGRHSRPADAGRREGDRRRRTVARSAASAGNDRSATYPRTSTSSTTRCAPTSRSAGAATRSTRKRSSRPFASRSSRTSSPGCLTALKRSSASAAFGSRADSASVSALLARSTSARASSSSTRQPRTSTGDRAAHRRDAGRLQTD